MLLHHRAMTTLTRRQLPAALERSVDRVLLLDDLICMAVATRGPSLVGFALGRTRERALERLCASKLGGVA